MARGRTMATVLTGCRNRLRYADYNQMNFERNFAQNFETILLFAIFELAYNSVFQLRINNSFSVQLSVLSKSSGTVVVC